MSGKVSREVNANVLMEIIRRANRNILPPEGAWVSIKGNPYAQRGLRIPESIHKLGIHHLDIYWAYDESIPWGFSEPAPLADFGLETNPNDIVDYILFSHLITDVQLTWMTLHTPISQLIRMWAGEVSVMKQDTINASLDEGYLQTIPIGGIQNNPIWDEETKDMVGSLMLDGMSYNRAQDELIAAGTLDTAARSWKFPPYFYRPTGDYYNVFCEEPEHDLYFTKGK
jgi:hypothetical protein